MKEESDQATTQDAASKERQQEVQSSNATPGNQALTTPTGSDNETAQPASEKETIEPAPAGGRSRTRVILLMSSLGLAVFLAALDQIIVATALPAIARNLEASSSSYAWIASAYLIAVASSIPLWGRLSDIFGRKPSIFSANLIFMVGSVISAVAQSLTTLIAGRAVQGTKLLAHTLV